MELASAIDLTKYPLPRVRHHVSPQVYLSAHTQADRTPWYPPTFESIDWSQWFVNGKPPSVLDIGCGRGGFLLAHALSFPNENVLGIEVRKMLVDWITGVAKGEGLGNVHAEWYSVVNGLRWIPSNSLLKTSYLFPDPWPKKRHYKRRAFSVAFLEEVHRVLHADGTLYLATDRVDVDTHQRSVFRVHGGFELTDIAEATEHLWPFPFSTDQQLFCERKGIGYHRYIARKK